MFTVGALVSGLNETWDTGMLYLVGHDQHRPIGWAAPLAVHIAPGLARLTAIIEIPETPDEEAAVTQVHIRRHSNRIEETVGPVRSELKARLQQFISGDIKESAFGCASFIQSGLARRAFPKIFEQEDKDGLIPLRTLKSISSGVFELDGLLFFAHPFLRRSLSRLNTLNTPFLSQLYGAAENTNLDVRIALDSDMVGLPATHHEKEELQYWFGPHFSDDVSSIPLGVTRHEASEEERFYSGISRTEFWWYEQGGARTFECEELLDSPSLGVGKTKFGCRFVHSITSDDQETFRHADGAIRLYEESAMLRRLEVDLKNSGRRTEYTKLWRIDGALQVQKWKRLMSDYFRDNMLIGEYLGGTDKVIEEIRETEKHEESAPSVYNYIPFRMFDEDGMDLSVSFHESFSAKYGERFVFSFDSLRNDSIKYHYIESDTVDVIKILKQGGNLIEMEDDLVTVRFEDDVLNLPLIVHTGENAVHAARKTMVGILTFLRRLFELRVEKLLTINISVNYNEHAIFFSFAGCVRPLFECFSLAEMQLPETLADLNKWCDCIAAATSKRYKPKNDNLWRTLKETGLLKFERKLLRPDQFHVKTNEDKIEILTTVPKEDQHIFKSEGIKPGKILLIKASECSLCGKPYKDCLHSKYLEEDVIHRISSVEPIGLAWSQGKQPAHRPQSP
ncbi:MAG: hypothetical protein JWM68_3679 [Verrucomicrobiales bacterium]|nr:hypothetical protein [Verrucomicrobiales bacterium]